MQNNQIATDLTFTIFRLNAKISAWGDNFTAPFGLTTARWQILGAIAHADKPINIPQIAEFIGMTRQGMLKQIDILLEKKLIEARANPQHKRSHVYVLTAHGQVVYDELAQAWTDFVEGQSTWHDDELAQALVVLKHFGLGF